MITSFILIVVSIVTTIVGAYLLLGVNLQKNIVTNHTNYISKYFVENIQFLPDDIRDTVKYGIKNLPVNPSPNKVDIITKRCLTSLLYLWIFTIFSILILWNIEHFDLYPLLEQTLFITITVFCLQLFIYYLLTNYRAIDPNKINYSFYTTLRTYANQCISDTLNVKANYWFGNPNGVRKEKLGTLYIDMINRSSIYVCLGGTKWLLLIDINRQLSRFLGLNVQTGNTLPNLFDGIFVNTSGNIPIVYTSTNHTWQRIINTKPSTLSIGSELPTKQTVGDLYLDTSTNLLYAKNGNTWNPTMTSVSTGSEPNPDTDIFINTVTNTTYRNTGTDWMII